MPGPRKWENATEVSVMLPNDLIALTRDVAELTTDRRGRKGRTVSRSALIRLGLDMVMDLPAAEIQKRLREMEAA